ncbi:Lipase_GDSL domain-containing protein [Cephalotus follicularis]|uniref:Lipase_GDSL domain-containing protein n=1 Tax=Cephalotus follicularis TaxID=3775 RepID=A0A1Q3CYU4_CEPFO|nr:Lipase_GDSL domain-containing protein [Cephalotus follicularis]
MKFLTEKHLPVSYSFSMLKFFFLVILVLFITVGAATTHPKNATFPAIIVFGDSIVDPGNNNYIMTLVKCDFSPYGRDFEGGNPTGRFSNGKVPSDFIAELYGVKELLPPYLDPNLQIKDLLTGVSFASGGAGYDPLTAKLVSVLSLSDQLNLFKDYLSKLKSAVGEEKTSTIMSKSLFIVCSGSDDIANNYDFLPIRRARYDLGSYTDVTASYASSFLQELYGLGARKIGVFSAPPIGCVPSQRTMGGGIERECSKKENQAATLFNSKLSSQVDALSKKFPDSWIVYLDVFHPLLSLIQNPAPYGFEVVDRGCCGTGNIEVSILCNGLEDALTCTDVSKYIFWDSYHPTEKAYKILASQIVQKYTSRFLEV